MDELTEYLMNTAEDGWVNPNKGKVRKVPRAEAKQERENNDLQRD